MDWDYLACSFLIRCRNYEKMVGKLSFWTRCVAYFQQFDRSIGMICPHLSYEKNYAVRTSCMQYSHVKRKFTTAVTQLWPRLVSRRKYYDCKTIKICLCCRNL